MLEKRRPQTEPEDVHEIHSIAAFRYAYDKLGRTLSLNTCEKQESTRSKSNTVDGAERPPYFKFGRVQPAHRTKGLWQQLRRQAGQVP